MKQRAGKHTR